MTELYGYADPLSVRAGEPINFMLSAESALEVKLALVRLFHGDENPAGPGFVEREVPSALPAGLDIVPQRTQRGNYIPVPDPEGVLGSPAAATIHAFICPSRPGGGDQVIAGAWGEQGFLLLIDAEGRLCLRMRDGSLTRSLTLRRALVPGCWYFVAGSFDSATGRLMLRQHSRINRWNSRLGPVAPYDLDDEAEFHATFAPPAPGAGSFVIGGRYGADGSVEALFNGKIDRPGIAQGCLPDAALMALADGRMPAPGDVLAYWDTSLGYGPDGIDNLFRDIGPAGLHAAGVNRPIRGMTGWNWAGKEDCFRLAPDQYGGVAFHDDALTDCRWNSSLEFIVPENLPSGVYALRLRTGERGERGEREEHIPFFVRPVKAAAPIAMLMSSFTYLAYANEHLSFEGSVAQVACANTPVVTPADLLWKSHEQFGLSTYDVHSDYAGVCHSSWRRPILNMRPRNRLPAAGVPWAFPADLSLVWWLDHAGYEVDILTDHDLHREGAAALAPYRAVLTSTHPEYCSTAMLDATEDYLTTGGRVLYLGGNSTLARALGKRLRGKAI